MHKLHWGIPAIIVGCFVCLAGRWMAQGLKFVTMTCQEEFTVGLSDAEYKVFGHLYFILALVWCTL